MNFPRSMRQQPWFVQFKSGIVEVLDAGAIERAFDAGMIDGRAMVCPVGSNVWATLAEAAGLSSEPFEIARPSLIEEEPPSLDRCTFGSFEAFDPRKNRASMWRPFAALAATFAALAVLAKFAIPAAMAAPQAKASPANTAPLTALMATADDPTELVPAPKKPRLTKDQIQRLQVMDWERFEKARSKNLPRKARTPATTIP